MKKYTKVLIIFVIVSALCIGSFYIGTRYSKKKYDLLRQVEYCDEIKSELTALSQLLDTESYDVGKLTELNNARIAILDLIDYMERLTTEGSALSEYSDFIQSLTLIYNAIEGGISYDGEFICYDFLYYNLLLEEEVKFLNEVKYDIDKILINMDSNESMTAEELEQHLSDFAKKYSPNNILNIFGELKLVYDNLKAQSLESKSIDVKEKKLEMLYGELYYPPELHIKHNSNDFTISGHIHSSWVIKSTTNDYLSIQNAGRSRMQPIDFIKFFNSKAYLYANNTFNIKFVAKPESYTIYRLSDDGTETATDYKLNENILVTGEEESMKYIVRADWKQGSAYYVFEIILRAPYDWTS